MLEEVIAKVIFKNNSIKWVKFCPYTLFTEMFVDSELLVGDPWSRVSEPEIDWKAEAGIAPFQWYSLQSAIMEHIKSTLLYYTRS